MACLGEKLLKRIQESPLGQRLPSRAQVLGFVHRRITETLILTVFIFVNCFAMNFMTILQQLLCLWMLVLPKRISVLITDRLLMAAACLSLVAQILGFTGWHTFSEEQALYFGVAPRLSDVCRDLFVIILAMIEGLLRDATEVVEDPIPMEQEMVVLGPVNRGSQASEEQSAAPRSLGDLQDTPEVVRPLDPVTEVGRLVTAVPQLAALAIVVINFFEETVWCLPSLLVVACFYATGGMVKPPVSSNPWQLPERGRLWIQVMVISLAVGMLGEICCTLWLPPIAGLSPKPVPEIIADWDMCRNYDPWNPTTPRNLEGQAQTRQILEADWVTQRQRCGSDVVYWLCLDSGLRVPKFVLFFTLCWVLHSRETEKLSPQTPGGWEGMPRWVHWTLDGISNYIYEGNRTAAQKESDLKLFLISLSTILCWISVIAAFLFQQHFNMVALGYLWMAMVTSSSAFNATLYQNPTRAILWPARAVGIFNFMVIVASSVCQCPSFPCPYSSELRGPLPGELHVTRFLSGEQCLYFSKNAVSGQVSDAWLMGPLFQSVGMMKTGSQSKGSLQELVHCLVFATCLLQRILVERWNSDLHEHFERRKALLEFRAQWYAEKLATSRQVQLSMWDTKRQVLLNKLSRVTQQLNTLRSIWDGQRPAFTEKEEEENLHRARVEHICLQGGVNELLVTGLLREFTKNCGEEAIQELNTQKRLQAHSIIDKAVVEYLHRRYLRKLKMITSADEAASKKLLLEDSQHEVESLFKEVQDTQETETEALPPERSSLRQRKVSDKQVSTTVSWQSEATEGSKSDESKPSGATVSPFWADLCGTFLDDMLFIRENDETLYEHRKGNSAKLLLLKSLLSQSVPALVIASALQFMAFRSIPAGLSVSIVVVALMAFPHVPWSVWVTLQWLNISVIFAKVVFQLPVFCEDGSLNLMAHCKALCGREMPWTALMGLVKTEQTASDPCSLARPSLTAVLWADVLFSAVVLLVMFASRMGGRFGSTSQILTSLKAVEKKNRRMSTHTNREMLKAVFLAERTADFEEDEEDEDEETGRDVAGPSGAASSSATPEDGSRWVMMTKHVRGEYQKFVELGRHWWKENVMAPAYVRKPARDLYELRLCLALTCLSMLIFGWSSMVDSGRSFSTSLKTNHFSVTQVTVLVLFLTMIVVDRALYTWYRGDRRDEENTVATAASKTLAFASMKGLAARVVLKILILVHVICIHALFVQQWSRKVVRKEKLHHDEVSLISMSTLSGFYVLYLTYLACSALQLKYDVHVMRGGLRFCHSTDIASMLVFKVYSAIPFLNELRVITDWTVTETSMNLFMWLKLEDAHHSLYRTRLDMEGRAMTEPGQARPMFEKVYMGVALLLLLLGLLVGPIIFFSAWNTFMLVPSVVKSASMSVDVKVEASYGHRTLNLYTAVQDYIANHNETSAQQFQKRLVDNEIPISLQDIRFPFASDEFWETSTSRQQMMAELINSSMHADVTVKLRLSYQFNRNSSLPVDGFKEVVVGDTTRTLLSVLMVNCIAPVDPKICPPYADFVVPGLFPKFLRVGTTSHVSAMDFLPEQEEPLNYAVKVAFHRGDVHELPHWRLVTNATETENSPISRTDMAMGQNEKGTRLTFTMVSNHISGSNSADRAEARNEKMSINGLYLGVVLTIGNLFRSIFKDSSKRMIYEEVNDTDLLLDLCDGIYLARVQGNLQAEWMLYHELIRIYRSPELLAHLSGKKGSSPVGPPRLPEPSTSTSRWGKVAEHVRHNAEGTK